MIKVEAHGDKQLFESLSGVGIRAAIGVLGVVEKGSLNIRNEVRQRWSGHPHIPHLPRTVTYDVDVSLRATTGEIGPDKSMGGQANLAHFVEFGRDDQAPLPALVPALATEAPRFEKALLDLGVRLLGR